MIVSHSRRFIAFHNPKCAGTSLRAALLAHHDDAVTFWGPQDAPYFRNQLDHTHLRLWELAALYPALFRAALADYRSVIFVRSPYARFLSAVAEHFKKFRRDLSFETLSREEQAAMVLRFLDRDLSIERVMTDWTMVHFSPQLWFLRLGDRVVPKEVIPMDPAGRFIERAFAALDVPPVAVVQENRSPFDLRHLLAAPRVRSFVQDFYASDFAFLAAAPELASLTALP